MKKIAGKTIIRLATADDCPAIMAVAQASYSVYIERMQAKPFPMLDDYSVHIQHQHVYVMEDDTVCGYVVLIPKDSASLLLDNIAVSPARQGMGYGRCLANFAEEWGRTHGYTRMCLYTNELMTENLIWYQRLSYSVTHKAVENGYRRIYMAKDL